MLTLFSQDRNSPRKSCLLSYWSAINQNSLPKLLNNLIPFNCWLQKLSPFLCNGIINPRGKASGKTPRANILLNVYVIILLNKKGRCKASMNTR